MPHSSRLDLLSPLVTVNAEGRITGASLVKAPIEPGPYLDSIRTGLPQNGLGEIAATATVTPGTLTPGEDGDVYQVTLTAGQTYSWDLRGLPDGIADPYIFLLNASFATVAADDDGGAGLGSLLTFTPTTSGTYYIYATSYDGGDIDGGGYTLASWTREADVPGSTNVAASIATAPALGLGTYYGHIDVAGDNDYFAVTVEAGEFYTFNFAGGAATNAELSTRGNTVATLSLYSSTGTLISSNLNFESGVSYFAQTDTTIYVRAQGFSTTTGGYTLDVTQVDLSARDPLESLNWDTAANIPTVLVDGVPTAYVYFAAAGENFGEKADDGTTPMTTYGWNETEMTAVMAALAQYTPITGINYVVTTDVAEATFRLLTTTSANYGAYFIPQDPSYGARQGIGVFNVNSGGWDRAGVSTQNLPGDQLSLQQGGFSFGVILHEFGHAHGVAHPHDRGGGSEIMLGVSGSTGSYGVYNLNQGVYTVMSYNDAWDFHPDGESSYSIQGIDNGWSGTLGAFDIAVLQARYGTHEHNGGDTNYALTDVVDDAFYQTIWDSGGTDTISYSGSLNAQIDLTAATLDYTPTGGGVISFLYNQPGVPAADEVKGGYTIADGVIIENATGGSGNDVLIGNSATNVLTGNAGNDNLLGRDGDDFLVGGAGDDMLDGGAGSDTADYATAASRVTVNLATGTATGGAGSDSLVSIENVFGSIHNDTITGSSVANLIRGGAGNDRIDGGGGNDTIVGGNGFDTVTLGGGDDIFVAEVGGDKIVLKGPNKGAMSVDVITDFDGAGNDVIDLSALGAFTFRGTDANKNAGDLTYKTFDSVNGAENALGLDIDGQAGRSSISGPVTVVFGNTDGGAADFAIVLLNTSSVDASDFLFAAAARAQAEQAALLNAAATDTSGYLFG